MALGLLLALAGLVLAACGGSSGSSSSAATEAESSTTATSSGGGLAAVPKETIGWVDATLAGSYQQRIYQAGKAALEHVGWEVKTVDTKGEPATAASGVSSLVNSGVDAIIMSAVTPSTARAGLLQAKSKGIPVLMVGSAVDNSLNESLGLVYYGESETELSEPLGELIAEDVKPGSKVGILSTTALASAVERTESLEKSLGEAGIEVLSPVETTFDFSSGQANASALLNQNPELAAIIPVFDIWTAATVSAIKAANRDEVAVYSYYADAVNTPLMRKNPTIVKGLADGNMIISPLIAVEQLLGYFAEQKEIDPSAAEGKFTYETITSKNLPPGAQNGPISIEEATAPFYAKWGKQYELPAS
jgi:ABC-type sugar transport system substrate-binding protein